MKTANSQKLNEIPRPHEVSVSKSVYRIAFGSILWHLYGCTIVNGASTIDSLLPSKQNASLSCGLPSKSDGKKPRGGCDETGHIKISESSSAGVRRGTAPPAHKSNDLAGGTDAAITVSVLDLGTLLGSIAVVLGKSSDWP